jgi:hypothetical protein
LIFVAHALDNGYSLTLVLNTFIYWFELLMVGHLFIFNPVSLSYVPNAENNQSISLFPHILIQA